LSAFVDIHELERSDNNYKSQLIEWGQKNKRDVQFDTHENPITGNDKPPFISIVRIDGQIAGKGEGYSKKEAQQNSACKALVNFSISDIT
jgi:ribonuclease-3